MYAIGYDYVRVAELFYVLLRVQIVTDVIDRATKDNREREHGKGGENQQFLD